MSAARARFLFLFMLAGCAPRVLWTADYGAHGSRAEILESGGAQWVRLDGRDGPRFEAVGDTGVIFSNDGKRLAYLAENGGRWRAVIDGERGSELDAIESGSLQFSLNALHVGYTGVIGSCAAIVVDGVFGACREEVRGLRLLDSGRVAAVVRAGSRARFLLGDELGPAVDAIGDWAVSDDGARAAYAAAENGTVRAIVDGVPGRDWRAVSNFRFGDAGRLLAFIARDGSRTRVVVDGVEGPPFATIHLLALAAAAPRVVYAAEDENGTRVVIDGEASGRFSAVMDLKVSPDGRHVAFVARRGGETLVVHDGRESRFEMVLPGTLQLSASGEHWAALAGDSTARRLFVALDGRPHKPLTLPEALGDPHKLIARALETP